MPHTVNETTADRRDLDPGSVQRIGAGVQPPAKAPIGDAETHFRQIADTAPMMMWIADAQKGCVWLNAPLLELVGCTCEQASGAGWREAVHPDDLDQCLKAYDDAFDRRAPFRMECRVRRHDGVWRDIDITGAPRSGPDGGFTGYIGSCLDVTEQKEAMWRQAEAALQRSEAQFRLLVKGVTDYAIYMLDPTGRVSSWNVGAERIKGYLPEEIVGEHFGRFYSEEDRAAGAPQHGLETARREGRFETEGWRIRKDGSRFRAHVVIDAIAGDNGEVIGFAKVTRDVTERQEAQRALEATREALYQSQKLEAIGQLTGGIAHDFNNLLMAVLGSLELARKRLPDDPHVRRLIDNAVQGAQRGASLTKRMLAFARRQELKREAVDLPALVAGMADLIERSLDSTYRIETCFPPDLGPVETDPAQVEAALLNLVVNARDSMPGGGVITISGRREEVDLDGSAHLAPGGYVCLSVADKGEGMDANVLARAVEPFFTTKGIGKGTGLGLSMIHGLASQSGGELRLHSQLGQGTTVELWLPVALGEVLDQPAPPVDLDPSAEQLLVLAVDDDELVLLNTAAMLEDLGHAVLQARNGAEALNILRDNPDVDLVITDQAMPTMTGLQLVEAIRAERPRIAIVIASGYAELAAGGPSDLVKLSKPFAQVELDAAIGKARPTIPREPGA